MTDYADESPANAEPSFTITPECISCGASGEVAPDLVRSGSGQYEFYRQPETAEEWQRAWRALQVCPVAAVRFVGDKSAREAGLGKDVFPHELVPGVWRLGFAAESSFGAHAYAARTRDGLVMVDGPRWSGRLKDWFEREGGIAHVLLTHQDDVGDARKYAERFGARVWIHEADRKAAPFATDIFRQPETEIAPGLLALHTPGHTEGSVVFHLAAPPCEDAPVLFGGDTLAWDRKRRRLIAFRDACWFSWDALRESLRGLHASRHRFAHCFAGHGGSISSDAGTLHASLGELVQRM